MNRMKRIVLLGGLLSATGLTCATTRVHADATASLAWSDGTTEPYSYAAPNAAIVGPSSAQTSKGAVTISCLVGPPANIINPQRQAWWGSVIADAPAALTQRALD